MQAVARAVASNNTNFMPRFVWFVNAAMRDVPTEPLEAIYLYSARMCSVVSLKFRLSANL
jgi:hypothetical protein